MRAAGRARSSIDVDADGWLTKHLGWLSDGQRIELECAARLRVRGRLPGASRRGSPEHASTEISTTSAEAHDDVGELLGERRELKLDVRRGVTTTF